MQQLNLLLTSLPDGILLGFVYGLAAMGLTLIWGVMNVINLSHGPIIALGMFGTFFAFIRLGINPYLGLFVVAILGLLLGVVIYFVAVHRVIDAPHLSSLLATFSVNMIIIGLGTAALTTSPYNVDFNMGSFRLGSVTILGTRVIAAVIAILFTAGLYGFLYRTRPGKFIRAVTNNRACGRVDGCALHPDSGPQLWAGDHAGSRIRGVDRHFLSIQYLVGGRLRIEELRHRRARWPRQPDWCVDGRPDPGRT